MDESAQLAPNGVRRQDVSVLIGVLAELEGILMAGDMPEVVARSLHRRFVRVGLLAEAANQRDLRQAMNNLNHRLRYAAGEYDEPIPPIPVPD